MGNWVTVGGEEIIFNNGVIGGMQESLEISANILEIHCPLLIMER